VTVAASTRTLWYLSRGTGVVALLLLTAVLLLGVLGVARWRSELLPRFVVQGLHRNLTLLAVLFVAIHVLTTVADGFAPIHLLDAIVPFASPYRPIWLGLGTVAFDLLLALTLTSLLRVRIGAGTWRAVHWLAYASWPVSLVHSLGTGSDARVGWLQALAAGCTGGVALAVLWRAAAAEGSGALRAGAAAAALLVPLGLLVWYRGGPGAPGWAARRCWPAGPRRAARSGPSGWWTPGRRRRSRPARCCPTCWAGSWRAAGWRSSCTGSRCRTSCRRCGPQGRSGSRSSTSTPTTATAPR